MIRLGGGCLGIISLGIVSACSGSGGGAHLQLDAGMAGAGGGIAPAGSTGTGGKGVPGTGGAGGTGGTSGTGGVGPTAVWRPFADTSPWNTPVPAGAAADPSSATLITDFANIAGQTEFWINIQDYSVPVYWVDSSSLSTVSVLASLGGTGFRTEAASDADAGGSGPAPIPGGAMPALGSDHHLAIVDRAARMEWGFWDADNSGGVWTAGEGSTIDLAGSGARPPEKSTPWWAGHGPRACGYGLLAGLITVDEMQAGSIEHALVVAYPHIRSRYYTPPASTAQGTTTDALQTRGILCGGRIQLDPTLDISTLGLSPSGLIIARALQRYGAFVGDYSGAVSLFADASPTALAAWNSGVLGNDEASKIPLSRFRVLTIGTMYDNMN